MALTKNRNTPEVEGKSFAYGLAANAVVFAGALVALTAAGFATPGAVANTLTAVGRAKREVSNTGGANGAVVVEVELGTFRFANSSGADEIEIADIGADCFIVDDETVAKTSGSNTRSVAGKIMQVDAAGVWVKFA